jgi:RNA polymerase sigma factor (sigma-70 family)
MRPSPAIDSSLITHYEGLVLRTAALYVERCEEDFEDIAQLFRIKVWKALESYDRRKVKAKLDTRTAEEHRDAYVYACIKNQGKDLEKRVKRNLACLDELAERQPVKLGIAREDEVYGVLRELPRLPSTLTAQERQVVTLLYLDFDNGEIAACMNVQRQTIVRQVRRIREKMADWKPTTTVSLPVPALPPALAAA